MSQEKAEFYFEAVRHYRQQATEAHQAGNPRLAAGYLLEAARNLLQLASSTKGPLREVQIGKARELRMLAQRMPAQPATKGTESRKAVTEAIGGEDTAQTQWELKERPTEKLADVAGLDDVKQELREKVIDPFRHPELYERFKVKVGGGILMYGPPGNGKTFIAKAVAGELDAAFFNVNASQIKDKYVGETEKNLQRLFDEARRHDRSVLFLDEVDHLLAKRGNRKVGTVAQFLSLTDGLVKNTNCMLVLAATNKPWILDEAVVRPGRLGTHIYVGPPDAVAREAIVAYSLREVPVAPEVVFAEVAAGTEGYSGADIAELCDRAKRSALVRQLTSGADESVQPDDFASALEKVRPSVTADLLQQFDQWRRARSGPADAHDEED